MTKVLFIPVTVRAVVRHVAVRIDSREAGHLDVRGEDRANLDIISLSQLDVRADRRARMDHGLPRARAASADGSPPAA